MTTKTAPVRKIRGTKQRPITKKASKKKQASVDRSKSYNEYKNFEGQQYTGMKVGRSHKWYYDKGEWKETKITPDLWEISNDYTTSLTGLKFKLAHKRADKDKWNASAKTQKKKLIKLLQGFIEQLEQEPVPIEFEYEDKEYKGAAVPISQTCNEGVCSEFDVSINDQSIGIIKRMSHNWKIDGVKDQKFVDVVGEQIEKWSH